jgi:ABC-type multidrug transport system fused ATPase/permease subunit
MVWLGSSLWLTIWVEAYNKEERPNSTFYIGIYGALAVAESVLYAILYLIFEAGSWRAARTLHRSLISAVFAAPLSWFKIVPIGRIVNRASRDMASVDTSLSQYLDAFLDSVITLFFRIGAIGSILPVFMIPAALSCFVGIAIGEMYTRTAVTVKKLVSSSQSPVFTQFSDTLAGLPVIRARSGMSEKFGKLLAERLRSWSRAAEANYNCNRWVAVRVDFITAMVGVCAGIIAVNKAGILSAGLVGFSLINATALSQTILGLVRYMNDLEVEMQSVSLVRPFPGQRTDEASSSFESASTGLLSLRTRTIRRTQRVENSRTTRLVLSRRTGQ